MSIEELPSTIEIPPLELPEDSLSGTMPEVESDLLPVQLDAPLDLSQALLSQLSQSLDAKVPEVRQVRFKTIAGKLTLILPTDKEVKDNIGLFYAELSWSDIQEQLEQRLIAGERFWQPQTLVYLQCGDRLLDTRQLQELADALQARELVLHNVATFRRQTAINAATAGFSVEQGAVSNELISSDNALDDPLYVKMTVRSGTEIRHPGSVIIFGDVNAGGEVIADGDILVWGKLKGLAHAGAKGNAQAVIMALHLEATQLRIGDFIARVETPATMYCPEVAHVSTVGSPSICIIRASDYSSLRT
jgi:septum site-determining protein MinC